MGAWKRIRVSEEPGPTAQEEPNPAAEAEPGPAAQEEPNPAAEAEPNPAEEAEPELPLFTVGLPYEQWPDRGYRRRPEDTGMRVSCLILLIVLLTSGIVLAMKWAAEQYEVPSFLFWVSDEHVGDLVLFLTMGALVFVHVVTRHMRASRGGAAVFPDRVEIAHPGTLGLLLGGGRISACPWDMISGYRDTSGAYVQLYRSGTWRLPFLSHAIPTPSEPERVTLLLHLDGHRLPRFG